MAAKISDLLRKEGHPGYAIDVASLETLVVKLRTRVEYLEGLCSDNGIPIHAAPAWIVELEPGVWLTEGEGDPPRTTVRANATSWMSLPTAKRLLGIARQHRPFLNSKIVQA